MYLLWVVLLPAVYFLHHALQRGEYECEWGTQFMTYVCKEAQLHLCQLYIHLMLLLFLLTPQIVAGDDAYQQGDSKQIKKIGPPRLVPGWQPVEHEGLDALSPAAVFVSGHQFECVIAFGQRGQKLPC